MSLPIDAATISPFNPRRCDGKCAAGKRLVKVQRQLSASNKRATTEKAKNSDYQTNISELLQRTRELEEQLREAKRHRRVAVKKSQNVDRYIHAAAESKQEADECKKDILRIKKQLSRANDTVATLRKELQTVRSALATAGDAEAERLARSIEENRRITIKSREAQSSAGSKLERALSKKQEAEMKLSSLSTRYVKVSNRSKNRGRALKRLRESIKSLKAKIIEVSALTGPQRKLKSKVTRRQMYNRRKAAEKAFATAIKVISDKWTVNLDGYGALELADGAEGEDAVVVTLKRGSREKHLIEKFLYLHDCGLSKKKLHEVRQLAPTAVPSVYSVNVAQKILNKIIDETLELEVNEHAFIVYPENLLRWIIKERGLEQFDTYDLILEGDGRGTGNSFKSVVIQFRIMNEGRLIMREDRQYMLALLVGEESRKSLHDDLGQLLDRLKKLQDDGIIIEGKRKRVRWHSTGDGKWQALLYGMVAFFVNDCNCLFCFCHASDRSDVSVHWETEEQRFVGELGEDGRKDIDLIPWIPMRRRWLENLHLVLRFCHDRIIAAVVTDIVNDESDTPAAGFTAAESLFREPPMNMTKFKILATKKKKGSPDGGFTWRTPPLKKILLFASQVEFKHLYKRNPDRGQLLQSGLRRWAAMYLEVQVWPGDGPELSCDDLFLKYSNFLADITEEAEGIPGMDDFKSKGLPLSIITPYAHMWCNHTPEQYQESKKYAHYFQRPLGSAPLPADVEYSRGGLKFARTDSMERKNLDFFHTYFQTNSRRHKEVIKSAGYSELRRTFSKHKAGKRHRAKFFCKWCAHGYVKEQDCAFHEDKCEQAPPRR